MKLYHFVLIFVILMITTIMILDVQIKDIKVVVRNKEQIDCSLEAAIDDGVTRLVQVMNSNNLIVDKDAAINSFFMSLNSAFGILSDQEAKQKLYLYIPVVTITMEDGYYIFYSDEYIGLDGNTYVSKRWSEKFPYYYEDEDFIYGFTLGDTVTLYDKNNILNKMNRQADSLVMNSNETQKVFQLNYHEIQTSQDYAAFRMERPYSILLSDEAYSSVKKGIIINCIETTMAYYTSRHNDIAQQYGITYNFSLPEISEAEWEPYLETNSMFVVFQGYPYGNESEEIFNRVASAGSKISKNKIYYLEQKGWYQIYHNCTCSALDSKGMIFDNEPYFTIENCVKAGAYACPICNVNGAFPPDYNP